MKEKLEAVVRFWKSRIGKISIVALALFILLFGVSLLLNLSSSTQLAKAKSESDSLLTENGEIKKKLDTSNNELDSVRQELDEVNQEFEEYKEKMKPYEEMEKAEAENREQKAKAEQEEREKAEEEKKAKEAEKKAQKAEERKKAEEEEKKEKEQEEAEKLKQGYETGITFENLARNPGEFTGEKVKFSGKVIQVMEGDTYNQMRLAVNDDYDKVIYIEVAKDLMADGRILEDDYITVMGVSFGLLDYESTLGGQITVPAVIVDDFEMQ